MPCLKVTKLDGSQQELELAEGTSMMDGLRDAGLVEGTCGGVASCGTCHVYFDSKDTAGERTEEEGWMLEGLEDFVEIREGSRLSCQVKITASHDDLAIDIAPEA